MAATLTAYLHVGPEQAREQWEKILARDRSARRQPTYAPVEIVLAYSLFFVLKPNRFGGRNIHLAPPVVHQLAQLTGRTPGSFTNKMLNLDGSRANAGQREWQIYERLCANPALHAQLYQVVMSAARATGIDEEQLPDFLGLETRSGFELSGQDEIDSLLLERESRPEAEKLERVLGATLDQTMRLVMHRARVGQHRFAQAVLVNCGQRCVFCGLPGATLAGSRLLVASHIKPWRVSNAQERLDHRNGVAACPTHDAAFDSGLLTINGGLRIHRAPPLQSMVAADPSARTFFDGPLLHSRAMFPEGADQPTEKYLRWHRENLFARHAV